jgi:hypothetical protein
MAIIVSYIDRSGSTVLENILKKSGLDIKFYACYKKDATMICIRDLRDVIVSSKRVEMSQIGNHKEFIHRKITKKEIEGYLSGGNRIAAQLKGLNKLLAENPGIQIWKYESWFNNYDWIFNELEKKPWNHNVPLEKREEIKNEFSLKSVRKLIKNDKDLINFSKWKKPHMFHGDHIWRGEPGSWKRLVPPELHSWFTHVLKEDLLRWGYIKKRFSDEILYGDSQKGK